MIHVHVEVERNINSAAENNRGKNMDKTLEQVMEEIKSGLTGNDEVDRDYLAQQMTKYRGNELGGAVARECTRMLFDILPKDGEIEIIGQWDDV